jgi:methylmalonyl-CoA/ethylmalonyl-CoA epimerase
LENKLVHIDQIAFAVDDMPSAIKAMKKIFGVEPDRESPAAGARHHMAFYRFANIELELIAPKSEHGTQAQFLRTHGKGVHHLRFDVDDYAKTLETLAGRGYPVLEEADSVRKEGVKIAYFNTEPDLGCYFEIINMQEAINREEEAQRR